MQINFSGAQPASLAGQTINVSAEADKAAPVTLRWPDDCRRAKRKIRRWLRAAAGIWRAGKKPAAGENLPLHARRGKKLSAGKIQRVRHQAQAAEAAIIRTARMPRREAQPAGISFHGFCFLYLIPKMNVEIVNTGSELMLGRVLNTHSAMALPPARRPRPRRHAAGGRCRHRRAKSSRPCARRWAARIWSSPPAASARLPTTSRAN